jgi:hypothetical protein
MNRKRAHANVVANKVVGRRIGWRSGGGGAAQGCEQGAELGAGSEDAVESDKGKMWVRAIYTWPSQHRRPVR